MPVLIGINLASEPFRRTRPLVAGATAAGVLLLGLLAVLVSGAVAARGRAAETRQAIAELERQLQAISREQASREAVLRQPENAEVLNRSLFLNALLYRKGISWTKIFNDLEGVLPHNVRLISVRPQVNAQNEILLEMVVGSQTSQPVIDFLMRLEASPLFGATSVHNWLPPTQNEPLIRYRLSVNYAQKL